MYTQIHFIHPYWLISWASIDYTWIIEFCDDDLYDLDINAQILMWHTCYRHYYSSKESEFIVYLLRDRPFTMAGDGAECIFLIHVNFSCPYKLFIEYFIPLQKVIEIFHTPTYCPQYSSTTCSLIRFADAFLQSPLPFEGSSFLIQMQLICRKLYCVNKCNVRLAEKGLKKMNHM